MSIGNLPQCPPMGTFNLPRITPVSVQTIVLPSGGRMSFTTINLPPLSLSAPFCQESTNKTCIAFEVQDYGLIIFLVVTCKSLNPLKSNQLLG